MVVSGQSVMHKLKQVAIREGKDVQKVATQYVIERFIARLRLVDVEGCVTVKGGQSLGMMFGAPARPSRDLDLNIKVPDGFDPFNWVRDLVAATCQVALDDGVVIVPDLLEFARRGHQSDHGGVRVLIKATIHTARIPFAIDVGVNNEMSFEPLTMSFDGVLKDERGAPLPIEVKIYPYENTIAEKIVSKVEDGAASIRHKDFFDLWWTIEVGRRIGDFRLLLASKGELSPEAAELVQTVRRHIREGAMLDAPVIGIADIVYDRIAHALPRTAASRGTAMPSDFIEFCRTEFADNVTQAMQWANWCRNNDQRFLAQPPGTLAGEDKARAFHILLDHLDPFFKNLKLAELRSLPPLRFG
jgi:hypothetical protein